MEKNASNHQDIEEEQENLQKSPSLSPIKNAEHQDGEDNDSDQLGRSSGEDQSDDHVHKKPRKLLQALVEAGLQESNLTNEVIRRWHNDEDHRLQHATNLFGSNWHAISQCVQNRSVFQCQRRLLTLLSPMTLKGQWTASEDAMLLGILHYAHESWGSVADMMPGRNSKQCRERWSHHLSPKVNKTPFLPSEDETLLALFNEHGNKWSKIARELPGRTENMIRSRLNSLITEGIYAFKMNKSKQ